MNQGEDNMLTIVFVLLLVINLEVSASLQHESAKDKRKLLKLGVILPYKGRQPWTLPKVLPALELALDKVKNSSLLDGYDVIINHNDSKCSDVYGPLSAFHLYRTDGAHVFIGPSCDYSVAPIARFSVEWGIPVLSAGALVHAFQDKREFPLLTRVTGSYVKVGYAVLELCRQFRWKHVGLIYSDFPMSLKGKSRSYFTMEPIYRTIQVRLGYAPWYKSFQESESVSGLRGQLEVILQEGKKNARVFIICAKPKYLKLFMMIANGLGMTSGDFVFIVIDLFLSQREIFQPWSPSEKEWDVFTEEENTTVKAMFDSVLLVTILPPDSASFKEFSREVNRRAQLLFPNEMMRDSQEEVSNFVLAFHDAVLLFAHALNETVMAGGSETDGRQINSRMWNRTIQGISGNVSIDPNGDRDADYALYDLDPKDDEFKLVRIYPGTEHTFRGVDRLEIHWPSQDIGQSPPLDVPVCGFVGEKCLPDEPFPVSVMVAIILSVLLVVVTILSLAIYRHLRLKAKMAELNWRIRAEDIIFETPQRGQGAELKPTSHRGSIPSALSFDSIGLFDSKSNAQLFTQTAYVKGNIVAVKRIFKSPITVNKTVLSDLRRMKNLQGEHIVRFVGLCLDAPQACILTEYCQKGSLQDVLENDAIKLDWMFRYSIMQDIVRGMTCLHASEIRFHGNLKSSNCVVDSRFVVKVTDFGLAYFRHTENNRHTESYAFYKGLLWTAPELLRDSTGREGGTQRGDVYSFAVICQEVIYRAGVFHIPCSDLTPREIYMKVIHPALHQSYFRPFLESIDCPCDELADVIKSCWAEDPSDRPDFPTLKSVIRKLNKDGDKGTLVDNLLTRMEIYATNLESVVAERTADYLDQKKKAEELLYSMLPRTVAQQLILGETVKAVSFDQVSIFFSDIVGFTSMSAQCSPMEVVTLLNDLYTTFDSILGNFDVYKVETIGDAYMVASGLPVPNGNTHAREIARMSLALLRAVDSFTVRHRPEEKLQLRIGIHSGTVCAGVVGLKMPRYCLFGDTVNTASRMESNGLPLKIHLSEPTKIVLDSFDSFIMELRGQVDMKGKGSLTTYWLLGEIRRTASQNLCTEA
ncbi:hypothetical protein RRG08_024796 [Elysia crispata]|uniref:Guanylate cyclase n=1 Tax=Elysia crispata TaxID=231223 RepID=A0AAE1CZM6_9GAST|nr:hypothetical protein RRG08_024796 [Elysia crispata]